MKIVLLGYMSSGKTTIGKALAEQLQIQFIDLDDYISNQLQMSISAIFQQKGELFFRKTEHQCLQEILSNSKYKDVVLALGGGTPCYYNNMECIQHSENTTSFYLKLNIESLLKRLWSEKENRPLIAHYKDKEGLEEFIRKHLFERQFYYLQANHTLAVSNYNVAETVKHIQLKLNKL